MDEPMPEYAGELTGLLADHQTFTAPDGRMWTRDREGFDAPWSEWEPVAAFESPAARTLYADLIAKLRAEGTSWREQVGEMPMFDEAAEALEHDERVIEKLSGLSKGYTMWSRARIKNLEEELERMKRLHEEATTNNADLRIKLEEAEERIETARQILKPRKGMKASDRDEAYRALSVLKPKIVPGKFEENGAPTIEWVLADRKRTGQWPGSPAQPHDRYGDGVEG